MSRVLRNQINTNAEHDSSVRQVTSNNENKDEPDRSSKFIFLGVAGLTILASLIILIIGNPHSLSNPVDPDGRQCGQGDIKDYPYIYFVTPSKQYLHRTVCVKECKDYSYIERQQFHNKQAKFSFLSKLSKQPKAGDSLQCAPNSIVTSCEFKISKEDRNDEVLIYDSKLYLNKICMPMNIVYYKLIFEALSINKLDQMLSDFNVTSPFIALFSVLTFLLSLATKFVIDNKGLINSTKLAFFLVSTLGFLILAILFLLRAINIITAPPPNDNDVVGNPELLQNKLDSSNSSFIGNIIFSFICMVNCVLFIKQFLDSRDEKTEEKQNIKKMSHDILGFISNVIKNQKLIYLPIVAFIIFIMLFSLFFFVVLNLFSLGSTSSQSNGLPFEQFQTNPLAKIFSIVIFVGFFWMFIFIVQVCEFIVYYLALQEMEYLYETKKEDQIERSRNFFEILQEELSRIKQFYIGTIALCSILSFVFYYPRSVLEWADTNYQHAKQKQQNKGCLFSIQEKISKAYEGSFLKSIQPYGFIKTIQKKVSFLEADNTTYWFEDMLDAGELLENEMKFSICFLVSLSFLCVVEQFDKFEISSIMVPVGLMVIVSFIISLLYVNMYGSIYSTFIIYFLVKQEINKIKEGKKIGIEYVSKFEEDQEKIQKENQNSLREFQGFVQKIIKENEDEEN